MEHFYSAEVFMLYAPTFFIHDFFICLLSIISLPLSLSLIYMAIHLTKTFFIYIYIMVAEKVTSLGKDWHRPCLKCEKCKKTLNAGGHAEHDGKPYCNYPCYAALFGPKGFGRGGAESYTFN
uniref:Cysteine rich protein 1 n=1 Tax=Laticauda laticaudata TaxID=8630 RepID=A0A8C5WVZ1_LATLA